MTDALTAMERAIEQALPFADDPAELYDELFEIDEAREELDGCDTDTVTQSREAGFDTFGPM